jgi:hypothetical protein
MLYRQIWVKARERIFLDHLQSSGKLSSSIAIFYGLPLPLGFVFTDAPPLVGLL